MGDEPFDLDAVGVEQAHQHGVGTVGIGGDEQAVGGPVARRAQADAHGDGAVLVELGLVEGHRTGVEHPVAVVEEGGAGPPDHVAARAVDQVVAELVAPDRSVVDGDLEGGAGWRVGPEAQGELAVGVDPQGLLDEQEPRLSARAPDRGDRLGRARSGPRWRAPAW